MREISGTGAPSLLIESGSVLTRALYVRDRFVLPSALPVPPLNPPVAPEVTSEVPPDAWDQWWCTLLERDTSLAMVPPADARLAALADVVYEDAHRWEAEHVTFDPLYDARWVSTWLIEHRLTVPVEVLLVGVGGLWHLQVGPARYLMSVELYRAHDRMDTLLRQALEAAQA